jgi:hypothetical protein
MSDSGDHATDQARLDALRAEIRDLERRYPQPAAAARVPDRLACPICGGPMVLGRASVRGTTLERILLGWSSEHLWFAPDAGGHRLADEDPVVPSGGHRRAWQCEACRATLVRGRR